MSEADIFLDSLAWNRLHTPSPEGTDPYLARVKHDVVNVFQSMLAATQQLQRGQAYDRERIAKVEAESRARIDTVVGDYKDLMKELFDIDEGAFIKTKAYTDRKVGRLYTAAIGVACSLVTASLMFAANFAMHR